MPSSTADAQAAQAADVITRVARSSPATGRALAGELHAAAIFDTNDWQRAIAILTNRVGRNMAVAIVDGLRREGVFGAEA
jgi:hypothetical protein